MDAAEHWGHMVGRKILSGFRGEIGRKISQFPIFTEPMKDKKPEARSFKSKPGAGSPSNPKDQKSKPKFSKSPKTAKSLSDVLHKNKTASTQKVSKAPGKKPSQAESRKSNIDDIKQLWNNARQKATQGEEREKAILNLMKKISGRVFELSLRHDCSRVMQFIFQSGNQEQRLSIVNELLPRLNEICKTPYGHFVLVKIISSNINIDIQKKIFSALKSHFVSLSTNTIGARVVESIFQTFPLKLTRELKSELFGNKFRLLLQEAPANLNSLLTQLPNKSASILDHMRDYCHKLIEKGLLIFNFVQGILLEYAQEITSDAKRMEDLITALVESFPKLITSKAGAKLCCLLSSYSTAKDRKKILKSFKGSVLKTLLDENGHLVIMRLVDATDDTVNIQKSLLEELISSEPISKFTATGEDISDPYPPLTTISLNQFGKKFMLHLISPSITHLEPDEEPFFGDNIANSKKSLEMKRRESLVFLKQALLEQASNHCNILLRDRSGSKVLEGIIIALFPKLLLESIVSAIFESVDESSQPAVFEDPCAHLVLKKILQLESVTSLEDSQSESDRTLWEDVEPNFFSSHILKHLEQKDTILRWFQSNRACLLLLDMLKLGAAHTRLMAVLKKNKAELTRVGEAHSGGKLLLAQLKGKK